MIRIHNTETNEIIDREMNADELKQYKADQAFHDNRKAELETLAASKLALLERLGITEDEAKLLLG